ncbi:hypothetical protein GCM10010327_57200 [Streptomyces nitrosporeus]|nr:hypothetical protein GCM10010327_57200 [Streptomyces nitrosporeus]
MVTGSQAQQVNNQEARGFGLSTARGCREIEHIFYDADDDVLRYTVTVDYSGQSYVTRHRPALEELARREQPAPTSWTFLAQASAGSAITRGVARWSVSPTTDIGVRLRGWGRGRGRGPCRRRGR